MTNITGDQNIFAPNDSIIGTDSSEDIRGLTGSDTIFGGEGNDSILGGSENDFLVGDDGDDTVRGEEGADLIYGGAGANLLVGGEGNDTLRSSDSDDTLEGGDGADLLVGNNGNDEFFGGDGADSAFGGINADFIDLGNGDDAGSGGSGADIILAGNGHDYARGDAGDDLLNGGRGNDTLDGSEGDDFIQGDEGDDLISFGEGVDSVFGGTGDDQFHIQLEGPGGIDYIFDYEVGNPDELIIIDLGVGLTVTPPSVTQVQNPESPGGIDTHLTFSDGHTVVLVGVNSNDINTEFGEGDLELTQGTRITGEKISSESNENNSFGFYIKDSSGNPSSGRLIWNNVRATPDGSVYTELLPGSVDDYGFFILNGAPADSIPDGSIIDFVAVPGQVPGTVAFEVFFEGERIDIDPTDHGRSDNQQNVAFFDDQAFNGDFESHDLESGRLVNIGGNRFSWEDDDNGRYGDLIFTQTLVAETNGFPDSPIPGGAPPEFFDSVPSSSDEGFEDPFSRTDIIELVNGDVTQGDSGDDSIDGTNQNDFLLGETGWDTLNGFDGDDTIEGGEGRDVLDGGNGNDLLNGEEDDDSIIGGAGNDIALGGDGDDTIEGGAGGDILDGGSGEDIIDGGDGDDFIFGGIGGDLLIGGEGSDIFFYNSFIESSTTVESGEGADTIRGFQQGQDLISLETLAFNQIREGTPVPDGLGYVYDADLDVTIVTADEGSFTIILEGNIQLTNDDFFGLTLEEPDSEIIGTDDPEELIGTSADDDIYAEGGNDTVFGREENDFIDGGEGDDLIFGEEGYDTIQGYLGNDTIDGGTNSGYVDIVVYLEAETSVVANLETGIITADGFTDVVTNIEGVAGGRFDDTLIGSDDVIFEVFQGGDGNDLIDGGDGNDIVIADYTFDDGVYDLAAGGATVGGGGDTDIYISIEGVEAGGGDDSVFGNDQNNTLAGGFGDDTIDGRGGYNILSFEYTDDDYNINLATGVSFTTSPGVPGTDSDIFTNIQGVTGGEGDDVITGSDGDNDIFDEYDGDDIIDAGAGDDTIVLRAGGNIVDGGAGNDEIVTGVHEDFVEGGTGNDTIVTGERSDTAQGGAGDDLIFGGAGGDFLQGGSGNDIIRGDDGDDIIVGGAGADELRGGAGNDTFLIEQVEHSQPGSFDTIVDFQQGRDTIDVSEFDFSELSSGANPIGNRLGFFYDAARNETIILDNAGTFELHLTGNIALSASDFAGLSGNVIEPADATLPFENFVVNGSEQLDEDGIYAFFGAQDTLTANGTLNLPNNADFLVRTGNGDDRVVHLGGDDTIIGSAGRDIFESGLSAGSNSGTQTYIYTDASQSNRNGGIDTIFGFNFETDQIVLSNLGYTQFTGNNDSGNGLRDNEIGYVDFGGRRVLFSGDGNFELVLVPEPNTVFPEWTVSTQEQYHFLVGLGQGGSFGQSSFFYGDTSDGLIINDDNNSFSVGNEGNALLPFETGSTENVIIGGEGDDNLRDLSNSNDSEGSDTIRGQGGDDRINTGAGDDEGYGDDGDDTIIGGEGSDSLHGGEDNDFLNGEEGRDLLVGGLGDDILIGDTATGNASSSGSDSFYGGLGADSLINTEVASSTRTDIFYYRSRDESSDAFGVDTIRDFQSGEDLIDITGLGFTAFVGTGLANTTELRLTDVNTDLGFATLISGDGSFRIEFANFQGLESSDFVGFINLPPEPEPDPGKYNVTTGDDTVIGDGENDPIDLLDGNDFVQGGFGNDTIDGGEGNDTLDYGYYNDSNNNGSNEGIAVNKSSATSGIAGSTIIQDTDLFSDIEVVITTQFNDTLLGSDEGDIFDAGAGNDIINGNGGNDFFFGGDGADAISGGAGDDTISYQNLERNLNVSLFSAGTGAIVHSGGRDDFSSVEEIIGSNLADTFTGGNGDDILNGYNGNDVISGGTGLDTLIGGTGSDTILYTYTDAAVNINAQTGQVIVQAGDVDAISGFEVYLTGIGNDTFQGTIEADSIDSGAGNDSISTSQGNDIIIAGEGNDFIDGGGDTDDINGGAGNDTINAGNGDDFVEGGDGNDSITNNDGADFLYGGDGDDTINASAIEEEFINAGRGNDVINGTVNGSDRFLFTELEAAGTIDRITGFEVASGDLIDLSNPAYHDFLYLSDLNISQVGSDAHIDLNGHTVILEGVAATSLTSDSFVGITEIEVGSVINGTAGADNLFSNADNDTINGLDGNDNISANNGNDDLNGGNGNDILDGDFGNDRLRGDAGNDILDGDNGNDRLNGGAGQDTLTGGAGEDTFVFSNIADSTVGVGDVITDFEVGIDLIDVSALGITFVHEGPASEGTLGYSYVAASDTTRIFNADNSFEIRLLGDFSGTGSDLTAASFIGVNGVL